VAVLRTILWFTGESGWHIKLQEQGEEKPEYCLLLSHNKIKSTGFDLVIRE
jgi:hypothetical protein